MIVPLTIARREPDPDGLDFEALQQAGLRLLQQLCGERWTDYNAHDPGVTMLDQLSYALTELAYRSSLPHEDYLAGADGVIDLERHALHLPQDILPSEAVTFDDWRHLLYDQIPQVEDVWVSNSDAGPGLTRVEIKLGDSVAHDGDDAGSEGVEDEDDDDDEDDEDENGADNNGDAPPLAAGRAAVEAWRDVHTVFAAGRALCQDISHVTVLKTQDFYLAGDIDIHSLRDPAAIYADIFFQCAHQVISGLRLGDYEQSAAGGASLDALFSGPYTEHGPIIDNEHRRARDPISLVRLVGLTRRIDGVKQVRRLELRDKNNQAPSDMVAGLKKGHVPRLRFPRTAAQKSWLRLHFMRSGVDDGQGGDRDDSNQSIDADAVTELIDDASVSLKKLLFESRALRRRKAPLGHLLDVPAGAGFALSPYTSIQQQFPAIYGINAYGVTAAAPPATRAKARQLKGYLYVFEQVMANYLQNLQEITRLFSIDADLDQSYFSQPINDRMLPDIEQLYVDPAGVADALNRIGRQFDPFEDRRDRVLDVLLGMYGERYTQQALRKFTFYFANDEQLRAWLLKNKLAFLMLIAELTRKRGSGFRYDLPSWNTDNVSGAQRKIAILLGLHELPCCRSLCEPLRRHGVRVVPDEHGDHDSLPALLERLRLPHAVGAPLRIPESMLRKAFSRQVLSKLSADPSAEQLESMRARMRQLNLECEGFHLVEHTLLRPRDPAQGDHPDTPPGFYGYQVSVVFPGWTARFADPEFRKLAQETVSLNLPAHVLPTFYWLGHVQMEDFETRFRGWLEKLCVAVRSRQRNDDAPAASAWQALDHASAGLLRFLQRQPRPSTVGTWV